MGEVDSRPHVVALAFLTQGHINPLMNFCLKLADHNIRVTFVTVNAPTLALGGHKPKQAPNIPQRYTDTIHLQQITLDLKPQTDVWSLEGYLAAFKAISNLEAPFEELVRQLHPKVRCIISDCMYSWTQDVSKRLGIPRASFWTAALASLAVDFFVPLLLQNGDIPVSESNRDNVISYVPGLTTLRASQLPFIYHAENSMTKTDPGYKRKIQRSIILKDDEWIIANSLEDLEPKAFRELREHLNPNILGVLPFDLPAEAHDNHEESKRSTHPLAGAIASWWKQDVECLEWLDTKSPNSVVYISFGSAVQLTADEFDELSKGIERSGQPFVWSLRPGSVSEESIDLFKDQTKSQGLVIPWAPQREVLAHTSTGAFVTHCGWNSMLEGICSGVPILACPKNAEQNLNCKLVVEDLGMGSSLMKEEQYESKFVPCDEIAERVRSVLGDAEVLKRAAAIKARVAKASLSQVKPFVDYLRQPWLYLKLN